jgi:hypothetical protein
MTEAPVRKLVYLYNSSLACTNHRGDKELFEVRLTAHLALSSRRTHRPEEANLFVHPACLVDAYFRARDGQRGSLRALNAIEAFVLSDIAALGFGHMPHAIFQLRCPKVSGTRDEGYWAGRQAFQHLWWSGRFLTFGCLQAFGTVDCRRAIHMPYCQRAEAELPVRNTTRDIRVLFIGSERGYGWNRRPVLALLNRTPGTHRVELLSRAKTGTDAGTGIGNR